MWKNLILLLVLHLLSSSGLQSRGITPLIDKILTDYNKIIRPRYSINNTIDVNVSMTLSSLGGIDEKRQRLTFTGWFNLFWKDDFLDWNATEYGVSMVTMPIEYLWTPDIYIINAEEDFREVEDPPSRGFVFSNGTVAWYPGSRYETFCKINIRLFPFDTQACNIWVSPWSSQFDGVVLSGTVPNTVVYWENSEWEVKNWSYSGKTNHETLVFTLEVKRRYMFHLLNIILPVVILSLLNNLVFILPVDSGEKVSLSISVLLSFIMLKTVIAEILPSNSDQVCFLGVFVLVMLGFSALSTLTSVLIVHYHLRGRSVRKDDDKPLCEQDTKKGQEFARKLNCITGILTILCTILVNLIFFLLIAFV